MKLYFAPLPENNAATPLIPQILANNSEYFLEIAKALKELGYSEVNLNLGCPSGTVVSKKRGAGFLSVPDSLDTFLGEIFEKCPLKISLKTRIGMEDISEYAGLDAKELKSIRKASSFTAYTSTRRQFQTQARSDLR